MNLQINKKYIINTISGYIANQKVKILGHINYERASQFSSFVTTVAINEKFIRTDNFEDYIENTTFYDCGVLKLDENTNELVLTGEHIILWDDVVDFNATELLEEDFVYALTLTVKNTSDEIIKQDDIIQAIKDLISKRYSTVECKIDKISSTKVDEIGAQLEEARAVLGSSTEALKTFVQLQDSAKKIITDFHDNNITNKVSTISSVVDEIYDNTLQIINNTR